MDFLAYLTPPLWLVALAPVLMALAYLHSHRKAPLWVRVAVVVPSLAVAGIFVILDAFPSSIPAEVRLFVSRVGIIVLFGWLAIVLWKTKGRHG